MSPYRNLIEENKLKECGNGDRYPHYVHSTHLECSLDNLLDGIVIQFDGPQIMQQMEAGIAKHFKLIVTEI